MSWPMVWAALFLQAGAIAINAKMAGPLAGWSVGFNMMVWVFSVVISTHGKKSNAER